MPHSDSPETNFTETEMVKFLARIRHFCSYQERCLHDVNTKLRQWKVSPANIRKITDILSEDGFLNEERYARIFVRSKFHINKWGRAKIRYELKNRFIQEGLANKAMDEIDENDYLKTIRQLILKKKSEINTGKNLNIREKIITFVTGKGFEYDLVSKVLTELNI